MGKLNDELCHFLNRPSVFAELINVGACGGQKVISAENLADVQRAYGETLQDRYGKKRKKIRKRDVVKALRVREGYVLLAVENQANLNYGMPLRCLEYDVEDFAKQLRRLQRHYKQDGGLKPGAEYLSGIRESDKLVPNITILLYHGAGKWDAADRLQDMIDLAGVDERIKALHMDYELHVINLRELDENLLETGLRELVGMVKRAGDKAGMQRFMEDNEARFKNMDDELYDLICTMLGLKELGRRRNQYENQGKETYDMCVAFQEMMRDSREEGRKIGRAEGEKSGERKGEKKGEKKGEARMGALILRLYNEGRTEEVRKAAESVRFRNRLYREYGM